MSKCFSFTATKNQCLKSSFSSRGLRSTVVDLKDGTIMHCWVPKTRKPTRPDLLLIHGFGANSMWQWGETVRILSPYFNVYVPDLVFFGDSYTTRPERSESFQAQCVKRVMELNSVVKMSVIGLSYGGFVAYNMAAQYKDCIEKVVICCAGVCLEEKDLEQGLFAVKSVEDAANILLPQTAEKMRELMGYTFVKAAHAKVLPSCLLTDFIHEMFTEYVEEKKELLLAIAKNRKLSDLPQITQPTLIVWGDQDKIFPLELGHRLKRFISPNGHLGDNAQLVVIKNAGHAFLYEKPREFHKPLKAFLLGSAKTTPKNP